LRLKKSRSSKQFHLAATEELASVKWSTELPSQAAESDEETMKRIFHLARELAEEMSFFKDDLIAIVRGPGGEEKAFREASEEKKIAVDATPSGTRSQLSVKARHTEEGVLKVCGILVERLNQEGGSWRNLRQLAEQCTDIDCVVSDLEGHQLKMQVTRATGDEKLWRPIGLGNKVTYTQKDEAAIEELWKEIDRKQARLPASQRAELVLVLDATDTPGLAFSRVVTLFRNRHGAWAKNLGFKAVWLVGPEKSLVFRLN